MNILSIIDEIAATASRLEKHAILEREQDNELLKAVIVAAYNPYINYHQKKIPQPVDYTGEVQTLEWGLEQLQALTNRMHTGHAAIEWLANVLGMLNEDDAEIISRVVTKDLRAGFSESTANKVWPNLVPTFDVMTCHKDISHIVYPAYGQLKMDGARCHLYFDGSHATAFARSGKEFKLCGVFDTVASYVMKKGETIDGELLFTDKNGKILDRKTSNGLANKANKGTLSTEEASRAIFVAWDIVDFTSKIKYKDRFEELSTRLTKTTGIKDKIRLVESIIVKDEEAAVEFFEEQLAKGEEGAILKNFDGVWEPKRSKNQGKMKAEEDCTLKIIALEEGKGKYKGKLGAFVCSTDNMSLIVNVGSGFSNKERITYFDQSLIGSYVDVVYNQIIDKKESTEKSLFLPRFSKMRFDKDKSDIF